MSVPKELFLKPNLDPLDPATQKLKRNLLVSSVITIGISSQEISIAKDFSFAGYRFEGLSVETLYISLLLVVLFFSVDFFLTIKNHLMENRIRLTGLNVAKPRAVPEMNNGEYDAVTTDERQSSIYSWWSSQINDIEQHKKTLKRIGPDLNKETVELQKLFIKDASSTIGQLNEKVNDISTMIRRFDESFWHHIRSQYKRFLFFDCITPLLLAAISICMCLFKINWCLILVCFR